MLTIGGRPCVTSIDVSNNQGQIDWAAVATAGLAFVHAKATEGNTFVDRWYRTNLSGATEHALPFGAYHFLRREYDARQQAQHFLAATDNLAGCTMPPQIDVEVSLVKTIPTAAQVLAFAADVEAATGMRPIIYMGAYLAIDRPAELAAYDLWLPGYPGSSVGQVANPAGLPLPHVGAPWGSWAVWQYAGGKYGRCPGVAGGCDRNVATVEWFNRVAGGGAHLEEDIMATKDELREVVGEQLHQALGPFIARDENTDGIFLVAGGQKHLLLDMGLVDIALKTGAIDKGNQGAWLATLASADPIAPANSADVNVDAIVAELRKLPAEVVAAIGSALAK